MLLNVTKPSLIDRLVRDLNPHVGPVAIAAIVTFLFVSLSYMFAYMTSPPAPKESIAPSAIHAPVDMEGLIKTSIANVQKQGKLVVTTMDLQSVSASEEPGMVSTTSITTAGWAKVQFSMDLRKFDPNWISVKDNDILVTIPKDYIQADIFATGFKDIDNSGWWSSEEEKKKLHDHNVKVNEAQMLTQANSMLEVARPAAAQELKNLFSIPIRAVSDKLVVRVIVG
jgi:hypothetical protein